MSDSTNTYLFSRGRRASQWAGDDPQALVGMMFYDLWKTRQQLFATLADGDNMLLLDTSSRRLIWHFRAAAVTKQEYHSLPEALEIVRRTFGLIPDNLNNYWVGRPDHGYVLAWAVEVVQPLDIEMPDGFTMGRNGYLPLTSIPEADRPTVPTFDPAQVLERPAAYVGGIDLREPGNRYIPQTIRQEVFKRDQGRCVICERTPPEVELHFDHKWPFSRGGTNNADNLQLLCAEHNLHKAASILDGAIPPPDTTLREALADRLGVSQSASLEVLIASTALDDDAVAELLIDEAQQGNHEEVDALLIKRPSLPKRDLIWSFVAWQYFFDDTDDSDIYAEERDNEIAAQLLTSSDLDAAASAALLLWELGVDGDLLEIALESNDPETRSLAALHLANQLEPSDPDAEELHRIAYRDGCGTIRPLAAFILATSVEMTAEEALELLAVGRSSGDPLIAASASAHTARIMLLIEEPAENALPYLEFAELAEFDEVTEEVAEIRKQFGL